MDNIGNQRVRDIEEFGSFDASDDIPSDPMQVARTDR